MPTDISVVSSSPRSDVETRAGSDRAWEGRPALAFAIRGTVFVVPIAASVLVSIWASRALPEPASLLGLVGWWLALLAISAGVLFVVDRVVRRLLPLAALLQLTMVFPDKAPARFKTALRSGSSVRHLKAQVAAAEEVGATGSATEAAAVILQLSNALNTHDRRTRGHAERVRAYTEMVAEEMGLGEEDRSKLRWASLLHDIGKLKVDTAILNKEGTLDDLEWDEVRQHPRHGAELCAPILEWLGPWADTIVDHHERFDGQGYPAGKKGDEISLGGRIVTVCDAFDVMTTVRSYKRPQPFTTARQELARQAGRHFDPEVVRAFLNVSVGKLRWVAGPISWLAQLPFLRFLGGIQQVGTAVGVAGVAATGVAAVVGAGMVDLPADDPLALLPPPASLVAAADRAAERGPNPPVVRATAVEEQPVVVVIADGSGNQADVIAVIRDPELGTVTLNGDGTVTYLPNENANGDDWFRTAAIIGDDEVTADVVVDIVGVNDPPVGVDDRVVTDEGASIIIPILDNDIDPERNFDVGTITFVTPPLHGAVAVLGNGSVRYSPDPSFFGNDGFRYRVCDTDGACTSALVSIEVRIVDDPPIVPGPGTLRLWEDTSVEFDPLRNAVDLDGSEVLLARIDSSSVAGAVITVATDGAYTYSPPPDFNGPDAFFFTATDGANEVTVRVEVTVDAVNDPPTGTIGPFSTKEDTSFVFDPIGGIDDPDGDDVLVVTIDAGTDGGGSIVAVGNEYRYTPRANFNGTDRFEVTVGDGTDTLDIEVVVVVSAVPDPPVAANDVYTVSDDTVHSVAAPGVAANDSDPDGQPLTVTLLTDVTHGTLSLASNGGFTYTPNAGYLGTDTFTYRVSDGAATDTATVSLNVIKRNEAPVVDAAGPFTIDEGDFVAFTVTVSDPDLYDDHTFAITGAPAGSSFDPNSGGFTWPTSEATGPSTVTFDIRATDDGDPAKSHTRTFTIVVREVNGAPILDSIGDRTVEEESTLSFVATAADPDDPPNTLTWSLVGAPPGASINPVNGQFTWTPPDGAAGDYTVTFKVVDDGDPSLSDTETITITVLPD